MEPCELARHADLEDVATLLIDLVRARRPAAEHPGRAAREQRAVAVDECGRLREPAEHVRRSADDEGVVSRGVVDVGSRAEVRVDTLVSEARGDSLGDPLGCAVARGVGDENEHDGPPRQRAGPVRPRMWAVVAPRQGPDVACRVAACCASRAAPRSRASPPRRAEPPAHRGWSEMSARRTMSSAACPAARVWGGSHARSSVSPPARTGRPSGLSAPRTLSGRVGRYRPWGAHLGMDGPKSRRTVRGADISEQTRVGLWVTSVGRTSRNGNGWRRARPGAARAARAAFRGFRRATKRPKEPDH